jgi:hypothetical protein
VWSPGAAHFAGPNQRVTYTCRPDNLEERDGGENDGRHDGGVFRIATVGRKREANGEPGLRLSSVAKIPTNGRCELQPSGCDSRADELAQRPSNYVYRAEPR